MEKKLSLMLRIAKAVIEIFEIELDEMIRKDEHKLEERNQSDCYGNRDYYNNFTHEE